MNNLPGYTGPSVGNVKIDTTRQYMIRRVVVDPVGVVRPLYSFDPTGRGTSTQLAHNGDYVLEQVMNIKTGKGIDFKMGYYNGHSWSHIATKAAAPVLTEVHAGVITWLKQSDVNDTKTLPFGWDGKQTDQGNWRKYRLRYLLAGAPQWWLNQVSELAGYWSDLHVIKARPMPSKFTLSGDESVFIRYKSKPPEVISGATTLRLSREAICLLVVRDNSIFPVQGFPTYGNRWEIYGDITSYQRSDHESRSNSRPEQGRYPEARSYE